MSYRERQKMDTTIKKKRMADATLTVQRADGTPLAHQELVIEQIRHKFLFGTAAFDLVPLANGEYSGAELERAEQRTEKLTAIFNAATLPFYWVSFEPQRGRPRTEQLRNAARWCKQRNLWVKGHPLCWHTLTADWLLGMDIPEILRAQTVRIRREVDDFRGLIDAWDVINEAVIMPIFDKYDNGLTRLCKEMGRIETIRAMFAAARQANPTALLLINDFDVSPAYDILVEGCLEAGIAIDAIGIQSHMHQGYWGVGKTLWILDRFSRFDLPIHFTETTLVSGRLMPPEIIDLNDYKVQDWPTTPDGEERQAQETIRHYETLFAHPTVESITWWDLCDGGWLNAPAGLLRKDGSTKPAYDELLKRIKGEWWTGSLKLATDQNGQVRFDGFLGDYELTLGGVRCSFTLTSPNAQAIEVRL
jgi:endo-1,4-beta-xylanase